METVVRTADPLLATSSTLPGMTARLRRHIIRKKPTMNHGTRRPNGSRPPCRELLPVFSLSKRMTGPSIRTRSNFTNVPI